MYSVIVLDRGRPIAKHPNLDRDVAHELTRAYLALGWPEDKVRLQMDEAIISQERVAA